MSHPVAWAIGGFGALKALDKVKWVHGTARVCYLESSPEGWVLVEMDDDRVFVADPETLQSFHAARQTGTPVRYWIDNFHRVYNRPRGGIGDISIVRRFF